MEGIDMEETQLKCTNGLLIVYSDRVVISRKTAFGFISQNFVGDRTIFYKDLMGIEYRKPTILANGYMKFIIAGTEETRQNLTNIGTTTREALKDPNTLILRAFNKEVQNKSEEIYNFIIKRINDYKSNISNNNISNADEIMKFKQLLDKGIITQEEFERKKQSLLK